MARNSPSHEPQSRSMARFTLAEVVSGPGVSRYGSPSRGGSHSKGLGGTAAPLSRVICDALLRGWAGALPAGSGAILRGADLSVKSLFCISSIGCANSSAAFRRPLPEPAALALRPTAGLPLRRDLRRVLARRRGALPDPAGHLRPGPQAGGGV